MEERIIQIEAYKLEALTGLLESCLLLWESTDPNNPNQCLAVKNLAEGISVVKQIINNGQLRKGG